MLPVADSLLTLLAAALCGGAVALLLPGLFGATWAQLTGRRRAGGEVATFLFEDERLIDASAAAQALLPAGEGGRAGASDLQRLVAQLEPRFTGIGALAEDLLTGERRHLGSSFGEARVELARWGARLRVTLTTAPRARDDAPPAVAAVMEELQVLRTIGDAAPLPIWKIDRTGRISWANSAYLTLCDMMRPMEGAAGDGRDWPPPIIFDQLAPPASEDDPASTRCDISLPGAARAQSFDITLVRRGGELIAYAVDVTEMAEATQARAEFVQTLSKTFAQLSIGLAIFDRQRRLMIFNPAFTDLTGFAVSFLSGRPTLASVLDRMRDKHILPEPKNYRSWREQLTRVESQARQGTFGETWVLPSGQTIRVTGRPHPDGALAFLFEDITGEVALTRHFREEMDLAQAVLDRTEEGIAVFTAGGRLSLANEPYEDMWGPAEARLSELVISSEIERWRQAAPSRVWQRLRETAETRSARRGWVGLVKRRDGRMLRLRVEPLPAGALLVGFLQTGLPDRPPAALPAPDSLPALMPAEAPPGE
ncbi:PAS-domain containing protein [Pseudoroseicyclus sp. CXY001]|uniref:PAS-domain containing protein n=1 Tax=Pseudoroseicyclus sp. CXY001 TaxID=3242492 RepID=UPI003570D1B5